MSKKGFTLVEVIAALAILMLITIIALPSIMSMRNDTLERTYETRVDLIKYAALNWANDNLELVPVTVHSTYVSQDTCDIDCTKKDGQCISVGLLIEEKYLSGSDNNETVMMDPRSNVSLNNKKVCVRYDKNDVRTRKLIAYLVK